MDNEVYLEPSIDRVLDVLSKSQRDSVFDALEQLRHDPLKNTQQVSGFDLRTMLAGGQRIYFRYVPEKNAVLVASVSASGEPVPA
jgi:mRNA-degrading endonuclease RelE of RelBE toxin-antitoxin system